MKRNKRYLLTVLLTLLFVFSGCRETAAPAEMVGLVPLPEYEDAPYVVVQGNQPAFTQKQKITESYEFYSELDALNRCGYVMACIGQDLMPDEERGSIGQVKPTGWHTVKYDFVDGKYLYNRCHLIGYQLTGENANERNLITGTRYMNVEGMLPFENMVADYVKETGNHVIYRVTPVFEGEELLARGVEMEAWSVEDNGEGICFHVYVFNVQPGVTINYVDGTSFAEEMIADEAAATYVLNKNSKKFHSRECKQCNTIAQDNKQIVTTTRQILIDQGYEPAGCCMSQE